MLRKCISCHTQANGMIGIYQHPNGLDIMFHTVTGVQVETEDHLCVPCYEEMKAAYRFKERSIQNNAQRLTAKSANNSTLSAVGDTGPSLDVCIVNEPLRTTEQINGNPRQENIRQLKEEAHLNAIELSVEEFIIHDAQQNVREDETEMVKEYANESMKEQPPSQYELTSDSMEERIPTTRATRKANASPSKSGASKELSLAKKSYNLPQLHSLMCEYCFKVFTELAEKIEHSGTHQSEAKPYKCFHDGCSGSFKDRKGLRSHVRVHAPVKRHVCSQCPMRFHTNHNLAAHERTHNGQKPFVCPKCHKSFAEAGNLKSHIRFHTDERPYLCTVCDKSFRTHYSRTVHTRSHSNDRPYVCEECGKGFITNGKLTIHRRTHTQERPYKCGSCESRYVDSSALRKHQRKVHGVNI
ncbi:zinc finger protein 664-like isoform X2 [Anopheles darlingi]|nr:zinc finger protein 664-like isoform X2 [Anopheles darlingi]XP_049531378.1 zinc finger protein 664-like isoform X2 [Anopheles darlingi]